jgi:hypothetical protein
LDASLKIRNGNIPDAIHKEIYNALGIAAKIMKPVETWRARDKHSDGIQRQVVGKTVHSAERGS